VGHSERRKYFRETDETINKKIKAALENGLKVILCVDKVSQIKKGIKGLSKKQFKNLVLAYEPVFAIGTGRPCSIEKARKMNILLRKALKKANIKILYGGSVNSQNAAIYIKEAKMSGLLIGGASLDPQEFIKIVKAI
jgi:triosephosphate isomerase